MVIDVREVLDHKQESMQAMSDYSWHFGTEFLKGKRVTRIWQFHPISV